MAVLGFAHTHQPGVGVLIHPVVSDGQHTSALPFATVMVGLAVALFALQGFTTAVYLSEEIQEPRRNVSRAVLWTLGLGAVVVIVPTVAITLGAGGADALTGAELRPHRHGQGLERLGGRRLRRAVHRRGDRERRDRHGDPELAHPVRLGAGQGVAGAGEPGAGHGLASASARRGSPRSAVGAPGTALCFAPVDTLNGITGVAVTGLYLIVAVAALAGRRGAHKTKSAWRMPLWPAVPVLVVASLVGVLFELWRTQPSDLYWTLGATAAAALYWVLYLRPRAATALADRRRPRPRRD